MNNFTLPKLELEGRSGCPIEVFSIDDQYFVRKESNSLDYNDRLRVQAEKQNSFHIRNHFKKIDSPRVIEIGTSVDSKRLYFLMEYIVGEKFSNFLARLSKNEIVELATILIEYLTFNSMQGKRGDPPTDIIDVKVLDLEQKLLNNSNFSRKFSFTALNYLKNNIPSSEIVLGDCHGDLTFSNILFNENGDLYIFDFLDSFIESPIIDIVKLRQDTKFYWSVEIDNQLDNNKRTKVLQVLNFIDNIIDSEIINTNKGYRDWYNYLELFNLVRIMPYVNKVRDIQFLQIHINKILKK
jgi:hypothetical protein